MGIRTEEDPTPEERFRALCNLIDESYKWQGLPHGSLERRVIKMLLEYKKELFLQIDRKEKQEIRDYIRKSFEAPKTETQPLTLEEIVRRIGKPVLIKDAAGRKEWKIPVKMDIEKEGFWIKFTDEEAIWHYWRDPLEFIYDRDTD